MTINTQKFVRKPFFVEAVQVTKENFSELAEWCQGKIETDRESGGSKKYIKVRVTYPKHPKQTRAYVGDWILYTDSGYKVYTNHAFEKSFDRVEPVTTGNSGPQPSEGVTIHEGELPVSALDQIRQLQAAGYSNSQIAEQLGLEHGELNAILTEGRQETTKEWKAVDPPVNVPEPLPMDPSVVTEVDGKRVLSIEDQKNLTPTEIRELVQSGEAILVQDLAEAQEAA